MNQASSGASRETEKLLVWLSQREEEMASLTSELVAIPTENPPGKNYHVCAGLLEKQLREFGLNWERISVPKKTNNDGDAPSILLASFGEGGRALYFSGHYDVVPAQSPEQFHKVRKEQFLFGRGSCDMKSGIVAMLFAVLALRETGVRLGGKISLILVPDEETGGDWGSGWLARQGRLGKNGIGMLTAEPTSGIVWNANRGAISLRVNVLGKSAHVGLQHQGENAFERMMPVVARLQELKREVERRTTACNIGAKQGRNSILLIGGQSAGGANFNVVPEKCWFTVDRRINPEEDFDAEKSRLIGVLEECKRDGIPLDWEILQEGRSASSSDTSPLAKALAGSVQSVTGEAAKFEMCPGLLETRFYASQNIPAYAYGPGLLSVAHGPNEYVDLRKVRDCAAIYAQTALNLLGA